jgi:Flp pilus assembly protein TadG
MKAISHIRGNLEFIAKLRRRFASESGQSLVELALLVPVLLLLVLGIVEMGRYTYLSILLGNAAESGALYGAQSLAQSADTTGIQNAAQADFQNGQSLPGLTVTSTNACGCDSGGTTTSAACGGTITAGTCAVGHWVVTVQVTATGNFSSLFRYPGIPASLTVSRTATLRVKQQ